jgi:hypothetical protein
VRGGGGGARRRRRLQVPSDHVVEVIPDAGHFVFLEQPRLFEAALLRTCAPHLRPGEAAAAVSGAASDGSFRVGAANGGGGAPPQQQQQQQQEEGGQPEPKPVP